MRPNCMACWVSEKAPLSTAWEAMTVAMVASRTMGSSNQPGYIRKKGLVSAAGLSSTRAAWPA